MAELADAADLGSVALCMRVQVSLWTLKTSLKLSIKHQCNGGKISSAQWVGETYVITAAPASLAR